jgi:hypothetical protein
MCQCDKSNINPILDTCICSYCAYNFCTHCQNAVCELCENTANEQSLCPQCSCSIYDLEICVCIECVYYHVLLGEIIFCYDCSNICESQQLNVHTYTHTSHNINTNIPEILQIISHKYPLIQHSGKIRFDQLIDTKLKL